MVLLPSTLPYFSYAPLDFSLQSSGDAASVVSAIKRFASGTAWFDMDASDLTEGGMREGVLNADIFIFLLTSNYLTR